MSKKDKNNYASLLIRREFRVMFDGLEDAEKGKLLTIAMDYHWDSKEPDDSLGKLYGIFLAMKPFIDDNIKDYAERCETNRLNRLGRDNKNNDDTHQS